MGGRWIGARMTDWGEDHDPKARSQVPSYPFSSTSLAALIFDAR
jgi:hypothetical protein